MPSRTPREARRSASLLVLSLVVACACVSAPSAFAQEANDTASSNTTPTSSVEKMQFHEAAHEENEEAEIDKFCNNDSCEIPPMTGDRDDQEYAN